MKPVKQSADRAKDFKGAIVKLVKYCKKYMPFIICAMFLAVAGTVLTILGPDYISDLTNHISNNMMIGIDFDSVLNVGKISLITKEHVVKVDGEKASLTLKEYELLKLFMENVGIVFSRNQLLSLIWSTDYVGESRTVDMHIKNLRQKLSQCGKYIQTVIGVGYKMERIDD